MSMAKQTPQFLMGADGSIGYESYSRQVPLVSSQTNPLSGLSIKTIWNGSQTQYDAIAVKDDATLYVIV